ncbi:MAG: ABC transporter permease [Chloroflexi bacterium]|nr:ABC transporter permease [Chloroflexota bacterium]
MALTANQQRVSRRRSTWHISRVAWPIAAFVIFLLAWEALIRIGDYPAFILPGPVAVAQKFVRVFADGTLLRHTGVTFIEVTGGLASGFTLATVTGYAIAKSPTLERILTPYIVASQAVPVVAIAPLLIIWFGTGITSKILISALIVFFPVLVTTITGVRSVPQELYDLMRSMQATPWQIFTRLEVPASMPVLMAGLKVGATLSVIGAVVGEFTGADAGLGFMINLADGLFDTARVFVGVFTLIAMALLLYGAVALLERRVLAWQRPTD